MSFFFSISSISLGGWECGKGREVGNEGGKVKGCVIKLGISSVDCFFKVISNF